MRLIDASDLRPLRQLTLAAFGEHEPKPTRRNAQRSPSAALDSDPADGDDPCSNAASHAAMAALEQLGIAALDLDAQHCVLASTRQSRQWLAHCTAASLTGSSTGTYLAWANAALQRRVSMAVDAVRNDGRGRALAWKDRGFNAHRPRTAQAVVALAPASSDRRQTRLFMLWPRLDEGHDGLDLLRQLWGLTAQETRVAKLLLGGADSAALADQLSVTRNTVKFHVRALLAKSGVRRRADLMLFLAGVRAPLG